MVHQGLSEYVVYQIKITPLIPLVELRETATSTRPTPASYFVYRRYSDFRRLQEELYSFTYQSKDKNRPRSLADMRKQFPLPTKGVVTYVVKTSRSHRQYRGLELSKWYATCSGVIPSPSPPAHPQAPPNPPAKHLHTMK